MPNHNNNLLIDTNILIYSINSSSPKIKQAQQFLMDYQSHGVVAHQNIFEAVRVLTHPKYPHPMQTKTALTALKSITGVFTIISPSIETYVFAQTLLEKYRYTADKVFDLYLVATMLSHEITTLATDNERDFFPIEEIKIVNPFK